MPKNMPLYVEREYYEIYENKYEKHIIENAILEKGNITDENFLKIKNTGFEFKNDNNFKLDIILELNERLGIEHSLIETEITRDKIEGLNEYLKLNRKYIHDKFNLKDKYPNAETSIRNSITFLSKIYKSWTGAEIKGEGQKRTKRYFL
jgi:hypothetical protein